MTAKVLDMEAGVHQRVQRLLAFDGALSEHDQHLVDAHVATCGACAEELLWQRKLKAVQPEAGAAPDMEAALARLTPQLDLRAPVRPRRPQWMGWALAAQLLVICGLVGYQWREQQDYRLLGAAPASDANLVVVFRPETSDRHVQAILQYNDARVVGGPTETHAWLLRVDPDRVEKVRHSLRTEPAVQMAETLQVPR
ncbi:MAG: anti-sigma factor family protein [Telluria sp.]